MMLLLPFTLLLIWENVPCQQEGESLDRRSHLDLPSFEMASSSGMWARFPLTNVSLSEEKFSH
jgi:hypothetical protein